ncbi:hypothetical protein [Endozoicomonas sp. 2B-B]
MTDLRWPDSLGQPKKNGYSYTLPMARNVSKINGPSGGINPQHQTIETFTVEYLWNDDQLIRFQQFREQESGYGESWFNQTLKIGFDFSDHQVRLLSVEEYQTDSVYWRVKVELECFRLNIIDDATAEFLLQYGSQETLAILAAADRYHETINWLVPFGATELERILSQSHEYYQTINYTLPEQWSKQ